MRLFGVLGLAGLMLICPAGVHGEEAVYRIIGPGQPIRHSVNGYTQTVLAERDGSLVVRVATQRVPVGGHGGFHSLRREHSVAVPEDFELPPSLARRLDFGMQAYQAATEVLRWVHTRLELDDGDFGDQDARSVLKRGRGRCSGLANATVALLMAAGFEARTVSGLLMEEEGPVPHRWVECRLPGAGWVPTDPALGYWVITHRHIAFQDTVSPVPQVEAVAVPAGSGLDGYPTERGIPRRPVVGAELVVRWVGRGPSSESAVAQLIGTGGEIRRSRLDPVGRFSGLMPGTWLLRVQCDDVVIHEQLVSLREAEVQSYAVRKELS